MSAALNAGRGVGLEVADMVALCNLVLERALMAYREPELLESAALAMDFCTLLRFLDIIMK